MSHVPDPAAVADLPAAERALAHGRRIPFLSWLGAELHRAEAGSSELHLSLQPQHMNSWQVSHGGVIMTLLDVAMATAARSMHPDWNGCATVEMKSSFVRPGKGTRLVARGTCFHRSSTMAFCEADVLDDSGTLVARGSGTFKYISKRIDAAPAA